MSNLLSALGMVEVFNYAYYQGGAWDIVNVKKDDFYVIGRSMQPFELCQVVSVNHCKNMIETIMVNYPDNVSAWTFKQFSSFQNHRLLVPEYVFEYKEFWVDKDIQMETKSIKDETIS